jgi:hypothetical protein
MPANKKAIAGMARSYKFNNPNVFATAISVRSNPAVPESNCFMLKN